jgi:transcriptional regulator of acetoin/glycerol metabolism
VLAEDSRIRAEDVELALHQPVEDAPPASESLADKETEQIQRVLQATAGNKAKAARILGIERKTLYRKLSKIGLD